MTQADELLKRFVAAFDAYQLNYPYWREKVAAERNAKKVRDEAQQYLENKQHDKDAK